MTLNRENIQDTLEIFYLYNTNNKKINFVNFYKIISYNHNAKKSLLKRKNH